MGKTFDGEDEVVEKENEVVEENGTEKEKSAQDNQVEAIKESDSTKEVGEKAKAKEDKEPLFFVDADGKTKNVYGRLAFEKATAEKLEILKKRRSKRIRTLVITVGILGLVGVAGTMAYFHNKAAKEALSVETVEETTTEEDLNVPVGSQGGADTDGKSVEEILGDKEVVSAPTISETEASLESSTEASESLTETQKAEQPTSESTKAEQTKAAIAESKGESAATETQAPQTQTPAPVETSPVESVPVETVPQNMDKDEFDAIKEVEESEIESMMNNEELMDYIKDNAKKLYGN